MCLLSVYKLIGILATVTIAVLVTRSKADRNYHKSSEEHLVSSLLDRYNEHKKISRPIHNSSEPINVTLGLSLTQIIAFSEKESTLTTRIWKYMTWRDEFLTWNKAEFGGLDVIALSPKSIWVPDIVLFNNVEQDTANSNIQEMLLVYSDGTIIWLPPIVYKSACAVSCNNFPFDAQTCSLKFGSWAYSTSRLNLFPHRDESYIDGVDLSEYGENPEWDLREVKAQRNELYYSCCNEPFVDITFKLVLQRRPGFYAHMMLLPILLLSVMILLLFWIPPQRPDRTTLGMSLFSAFFLLLLVIIEKAPPSAETKLGTFCGMNIMATAGASLVSVLVVNLSIRKYKMPECLKKVFVVWLHDTLFVCPPGRRQVVEAEATHKLSGSSPESQAGQANQETVPTGEGQRTYADEWIIMATVVNRIFFSIYVTVLLYGIIFIFPWTYEDISET